MFLLSISVLTNNNNTKKLWCLQTVITFHRVLESWTENGVSKYVSDSPKRKNQPHTHQSGYPLCYSLKRGCGWLLVEDFKNKRGMDNHLNFCLTFILIKLVLPLFRCCDHFQGYNVTNSRSIFMKEWMCYRVHIKNRFYPLYALTCHTNV